MQHFSTLGNAAYKFFQTFRANPTWAKQLKWLDWKNNGAELSTTDIGLYNGAEFRQSSGFMLSMVKQLESPWNLATMCSKYFQYQCV